MIIRRPVQQVFSLRFSFSFIDPALITFIAIIGFLGLVVLYSASGQDNVLVFHQFVRLLIGFLLLFIFSNIPISSLRRWTPIFFFASVALLVLVSATGDAGHGAKRWLDFFLFRFQPSELVKITMPMMLALILGAHSLPPSFLRLLSSLIIIAIPVILVAVQPDLGTSLLIAASGFIALILSGISVWIFSVFFLIVLTTVPLAWKYLLYDYQKQRILTLLDPEADPLGAGYHIIQSKIAVGSGGLYGKGWLNGTQSHLDFLPERSTDFIFAVFAEEFGFIGVVLLLILYGLILRRIFQITFNAPDHYSRILAGTLGLGLLLYIFVNIGMVIGIIPVVGAPLPLLSFGGTYIASLMIGFGILMSINAHKKRMA